MLDKIIERDAISAIDQPVTYDEAAADREYHNGEAVIGVSINGESRAYSTAYMEAHEIVNDVVGGQRIVVSWSPLSYSAAVYGREVEGRELTFGSSGELAMNTPVWYDRQTGSRWTQVTGEAIDGELQGKQLIAVPAQVTKWADWKARHPETTALEKGSRTLFSSYTPYYRSGDAGVTQRVQEDGRLKPQDLVLGVVAGDSARAYSYASLRKEPVVNDDLDGQPALVVFDAANALGVAYSRRLDDGRVLSFKQSEGTTLVDTETGSTWSGVDGPRNGRQARRHATAPIQKHVDVLVCLEGLVPGRGAEAVAALATKQAPDLKDQGLVVRHPPAQAARRWAGPANSLRTLCALTGSSSPASRRFHASTSHTSGAASRT